MKTPRSLILTGSLLLIIGSGSSLSQQPKPSPEPPSFPALPSSARVWKSVTTGKEYAVWIENDRLFAVWVNVPANLASVGASIRIECRRANGKWLGSAQNHLPCETTDNGKHVTNFCRITSKIEFNAIQAARITGRTEWVRRFDCANCRILEPAWANFEWVPKEPSPVSSKP